MHYIMARVRRVIVAGDASGGFGSVALCQGCSTRARVCHENRETASARERERLRACEHSRGTETRSAGVFSCLDCSILDN